jgi:hypothetical protein
MQIATAIDVKDSLGPSIDRFLQCLLTLCKKVFVENNVNNKKFDKSVR